MILQDRVRLKVFHGREARHLPERAVEMRLVVEHTRIDMLDDAWGCGSKIAGLFQERMNVSYTLQLFPA